MALNTREQLFAKEYIINSGNTYQAALKAGYKEKTAKTAYEWLLETLPNPTAKRHLPYKPELAAEIQAELDRIKSEKTADATEVLEFLTSIMRGEKTEQTLRLVGDGVQTIDDIDVNAKERLKAAELLGKTMGIFTDKLNIGLEPVMIINDLKE